MNNLPIIDLVATGKRITELRKENGFTVKDIQQAFEFGTPQAVYKWQNGASLPSIDNLVALSMLFNVKIEDILVFSN